VRTTGRIGVVRLCDIESKKDGTRLFFLAGRKALEYSQQETNILRELRKAASCSTPELLATFEKAQSQARDLTKEIARLWTQMLPGLAASAQVREVQSSKVGVQVAEVPPQLVAKLAGLIAETTEGVGIAVSGTRIAISSRTLDAAALLKTIQSAVGGKGGGSAGAANGNLGRTVTADEILTILQS
jgi:alanyl-tRNA synthetase